MTSYSYTITFNESEFITLKASLELYQKECRQQLIERQSLKICLAPYWAHNQRIDDINEKISQAISRNFGNDLYDLTN